MRVLMLSGVLGFLLALPAQASEAWLAAREAFRQGNDAGLVRAARDLQGSPLAIYGDYWQVWRQAQRAEGDAVVADFLRREASSYLAEQLRSHWLVQLGRRQDWGQFRQQFPLLQGSVSTDLLCWSLQADLAANQLDRLREAAEGLWLTARDQPASCTPVLAALFERGLYGQHERWLRVREALEANASGVARHVAQAAGYPLSDRDVAALTSQPRQQIERLDLSQRGGRELAAFAYGRWARIDPVAAQAHLTAHEGRLQMQAAYAWRGLAMAAARRFDPEAEVLFARSEATDWTTVHWETRLRQLVRHGQWSAYRGVYARLPASLQNQRSWRYWQARALEADGERQPAQQLFAQLSVEDDYYGLLSSERLGAVLAAPSRAVSLTRTDRERLRQHAGFQRALALHALGQRWEAAAEWNWATRGADDRLLLAAAEAAAERGWYDRAIFAAERTRELHEPRFRFIAPYRDVVRAQAREMRLDEAWVYGLMRQESRFVSNARSSAGAGGLMQVMPATAQWVARRIGIPYRADMTNDVGQNVRLGTYYLQHVLGTLGDPVLATAGYNAGPGRARQWQGPEALEGARFVESIPFFETRDYVKKVKTNAIHYARIFGEGETVLSRRLGIVPAAGVLQVANEAMPAGEQP